jgi:transposase
MVGKRSLKSDETRTYIKARNELKIDPNSIFNEICQVYGDNEVSYRLVRNWIAKFNSGLDSIQDVSRSGRRPTAVTPNNISKISNILKSDARYTSPEIAQMTGISEGSARRILKKNLGLSRKVARWIPHILTKDQLTQRVKMAKKTLEVIP